MVIGKLRFSFLDLKEFAIRFNICTFIKDYSIFVALEFRKRLPRFFTLCRPDENYLTNHAKLLDPRGQIYRCLQTLPERRLYRTDNIYLIALLK